MIIDDEICLTPINQRSPQHGQNKENSMEDVCDGPMDQQLSEGTPCNIEHSSSEDS